MSRRSQYIAERARSQRDGGIGMAMFRMQEREKRRKENNRISKRLSRDLSSIGRGAVTLLVGGKRRRRRRR
jgi:hypothetical protein